MAILKNLTKKASLYMLAGALIGLPSIGHAETKNIDDIILENAAKNQTIMFGEMHTAIINKDEEIAVFADNKYVASLLPELKEIGYDKLALEIDSSNQQWLESYLKEKLSENELLKTVPYINLMKDVLKKGKELGMEVYAIDERPVDKLLPWEGPPSEYGTDRNLKMFENMKRMIFDKDPNAKVVVFIGSIHTAESPIIYKRFPEEPQLMLGYFLSKYTKDRNYSIDIWLGHRYSLKVDLDANENPELFKEIYDEFRNEIATYLKNSSIK